MHKIRLVLAGLFFLFFSWGMMAQNPPDPPDGHGDEGDQPPGGDAPVGAGVYLLVVLGAAYGAGKVFVMKKGDRRACLPDEGQ